MLGETPQQQLMPTIDHFAKTKGVKSYYLIGNDYVWPRVTNKLAKNILLGPAAMSLVKNIFPSARQKFEFAVTRIKSAKPDLVVITLVGGIMSILTELLLSLALIRI